LDTSEVGFGVRNYTLELSDTAELHRAVDDAADGEVVFLRRAHRIVGAIVPPEVAAAGMAALDAADHVADLSLGESLLADLRDGMETFPLSDLRGELT
jgi:hypothetical protein